MTLRVAIFKPHLAMSLAKLAQELTVLTKYQFWTLSNPQHTFESAEEYPIDFKAFKDLIGSDLEDDDNALGEFLESSTGVTTLTIHSPATDSRPFSTELCHEPSEKPMTYEEILYMIVRLYHPNDQDDWVDKIEVDPNHPSRLLISLTR